MITSHCKSKKRAQINAILKKEFLDDKFCTKDLEKKSSLKSISSIKIKYVSRQIMSVVTQYDIYCGGPYPNQGKLYTTYNLTSGEKFDLLNQVKDMSVFRAFLAKQFQRHIPQKVPQTCHDLYSTEELLHMDPQFILTARALIIRADYVHAVKICEFDIAIQRCTMNQFLKSDSLLGLRCT